MKKKLLAKSPKQTYDDNDYNEENLDVIEENLFNEAIESKLAGLIASSPSSSPTLMAVMISSDTSVTVYSGCQKAGPQTA